ncbi:TPA: thiamine ABC transporter permease [Enterobacter asburiae]|nr:thiamine ABC transporter permease [Enterobacter asburiae]
MAASLRHPLSGLVWLAMAVIYLPILPAGVMLFAPALSATNWQRLLNDPQLPQATVATLVSTLIATLGALLIALFFVCLLWPGQRWRRLTTRLPWLLAIPHVAFATSALLLFAEGGLFYQLCTVCTAPFDRYGVGLGLTLAVKESAFVLWAIYAVLPEQRLAQQQAKGMLLCLFLLMLLAALAALGYGLWRVWRRTIPDLAGTRRRSQRTLPERAFSGLLPACGILCAAVLLMLAQGGDVGSVGTSLSFGLLSSLIALIVIFLWLEWGPQRRAAWVWSPLALPALPLVTGQYFIALRLGLDGRYAAVLWSHLLWVLPWMLLVLQPAWRRIDPRLILTARTLGWRRAKIFLLLKCPLLVRPALLAFAIGFSVSMAQYMPTLWLGAGRFATLTTETVALSSGGSIPTLANRALGLLLVTGTVFGLAALLSRLAGRYRQGLR